MANFKIKRNKLFMLLSLVCLSSATHSQTTVIDYSMSVLAPMGAAVFSQNLYIGPNARIIVNDTWRIAAQNIYIHPDATLSGSGTVLLDNPSTYTIGGATLTWARQNIDGGGVNIDVAIQLNNPNDVGLVEISPPLAYPSWVTAINPLSDDLFIGVSLNYTVDDGHIQLNDKNLVLDSSAEQNGYNGLRYVVTNGTGHMVKESLPATDSFYFPVGRSESDYTPAKLTNLSAAVQDYWVQVKNYAESSSNEASPDNGMYRSWHIYTAGASSMVSTKLSLQHNTSTNGIDYVSANGFVTRQNSSTGGPEWLQGPPVSIVGSPVNAGAGTVTGSELHIRTLSVPNSGAVDSSWFSKSSDPYTPLPVDWLFFGAEKVNDKMAILHWKVVEDVHCSHYLVQQGSNGATWKTIGQVTAEKGRQNISAYRLIDSAPKVGTNYYRIVQVDYNRNEDISAIRKLTFYHSSSLKIFPNPAHKEIGLIGLPEAGVLDIHLVDAGGKTIFQRQQSVQEDRVILNDNLARGIYSLILELNGKKEVYHLQIDY